MNFICEHCQQSFETSPRKDRRVRFCSTRCRIDGGRKFTDEQLRSLASGGFFQTQIARECDVDPHRVKREMQLAGLYERWREQRYA